jgi:hypothetical protein
MLLIAAGNCRALAAEPPQVPPSQAAPAAGAEAKDAAAQQVAKDYLTGVNGAGLDGGIPFLHPDELARFKKLMLPILEQERQAGRRHLLNATFGRDAEMVDVRLVAPDDFMRRFARVASARLDQTPTRFDRVETIGTIAEGEVRHVLIREVAEKGGARTQRLVVVSLRLSDREWKVLLGSDIESLLDALQGRPAGGDPSDRRAHPVPEGASLGPRDGDVPQGPAPAPGARPLR